MIFFKGTSVFYKPGIIIGGKFEHDCGLERGIGYFIEVLAVLGPFGKEPLKVTLKGITNHNNNLDMSADIIQHVMIPNMKHFGIDENLNFKILKRGASPNGGGIALFTCPILNSLTPITLIDDGKIKRIRGVAYTTRASPTLSTRMIQTCREIMNPYASDIYIYSDVSSNKDSGGSSGYGISLVAEMTTGCLISFEQMAQPQQIPEELAEETTKLFLFEILRRGCVDSMHQSLMLLLMAVGSEDVSKIRLGKLSQYSINYLRNIKEFFGVTFKIEPDAESKTILLTCLGAGIKNLSKKFF